jgi:anaphase-promoting complex subunit 6
MAQRSVRDEVHEGTNVIITLVYVLYITNTYKYKPQADLERTNQNIQQKLQLINDEDVLTSQAQNYFYHNQFDKAYAITKKYVLAFITKHQLKISFFRILNEDPHNFSNALVIHISCMVELSLKNDLFYCAHKLVDNHPELYIAWYAVGCYYYLIGNYENARRYFR